MYDAHVKFSPGKGRKQVGPSPAHCAGSSQGNVTSVTPFVTLLDIHGRCVYPRKGLREKSCRSNASNVRQMGPSSDVAYE